MSNLMEEVKAVVADAFHQVGAERLTDYVTVTPLFKGKTEGVRVSMNRDLWDDFRDEEIRNAAYEQLSEVHRIYRDVLNSRQYTEEQLRVQPSYGLNMEWQTDVTPKHITMGQVGIF